MALLIIQFILAFFVAHAADKPAAEAKKDSPTEAIKAAIENAASQAIAPTPIENQKEQSPPEQPAQDQNPAPINQQTADNSPPEPPPPKPNFPQAQPPPVLEQIKNTRKYAIIRVSYGNGLSGKMKFKLYWDKMYATVQNFIGLATGTKGFVDKDTSKMVQRPFYDGLTFYRFVPGFVMQSGCPFGNGKGFPGFTIRDEFHPDLHHDKMGRLAMAKQINDEKKVVPNSSGSQFYITLGPLPELDSEYAVFGAIMDDDRASFNVLNKIVANTVADFNAVPIKPITIEHIEILEQ